MSNGQGVVYRRLEMEKWGLQDVIEVRHAVRQLLPERQAMEEYLGRGGVLPVQDAEAIAKWIMDDIDGFKESVKKSGSALARFLRGMREFEDGEKEAAISNCKAVAKELKDSWAVPQIVELLIRARELDEAEKLLKNVPGEIEGHAQVEYLAGRICEMRYDWVGALEKYDAALEKSPGHPHAAFRKAYILDLRGEDNEALEAYREAGLSKNRFVGALVNMGLLYEDKGELDKAITCFKEALRVLPTDRRVALYLTAATEATQEVYDEAERKEMERVRKLLRTPLAEFELSVRSRNCLSRMGLNTLWDLVQKTEAELLSHKNFGETSLREIKQLLASRGLRLGMSREMTAQRAVRHMLTTATEGSAVDPELLDQPVSSLNLSVRASNGLEALGLETLGELIKMTDEDLLGIKNFGLVSLNEVKMKLSSLGLSFRVPAKNDH
ncbi:MAG: tetratricopeptide repeat protein [Planctomycetes bacterium]|nr:tetratricopeptide repeat protein [Planctomycetota bacterium]